MFVSRRELLKFRSNLKTLISGEIHHKINRKIEGAHDNIMNCSQDYLIVYANNCGAVVGNLHTMVLP